MLNALFDFFRWVFSLWSNCFRFVFNGIGKAVSAVTGAMSWVAAHVIYWPLMLFTDSSAEGIFTWWPLFCLIWVILLLLIVVIAVCAVIAYRKRKQ